MKKKFIFISCALLLSTFSSCNNTSEDYLTFIALNDNSNFICTRTHNYAYSKCPNLYYSVDKKTWNPIDITDETIAPFNPYIKLNKGERVYLKGSNKYGISISEEEFIHFGCIDENEDDLTFSSSGSIMSLIDNGRGNTYEIPCEYCFYSMFATTDYCECKLVNSPKLPATKLKAHCYERMFFDNASLVSSSELPSIDIEEKCYAYMFSQCISLKNSPALKAVKTAPYCYDHMFYGNASLENLEIHIKDWDREGDFPCCFWVSFDGDHPMSQSGTFRCPKELIPDITDPNNFSETRVPYHWTIETF